MKKILTASISAFICLLSVNQVEAKQSTNSNPWGFTGLINMPTGDIQKTGEFDVNLNYLFIKPGFIMNGHMGIFDRLELGIVGGVPNAGFSGLAGNLKYQLLKPTEKNPTSFAIGVNLIGLATNTYLTNGNYLYMVGSHDFNLKLKDNSNYNIFSGHLGFGGNHFGSRLMLGVDVPVTDYVNINAEYLGKIEALDEMFNFGIKAKPIPKLPDFTISLLSSGTSLKGFGNTEVFLSMAYSARIMPLQKAETEDIKVAGTIEQINEYEKTKNIKDKVEEKKEEKFDNIKKIPIPPPTPAPTKTPEIIKKEVLSDNEKKSKKSDEGIKVTPTPAPTKAPEITKVAVSEEVKKEATTGFLKGYVKNVSDSKKMQNVSIKIKSSNSNFEKKTSTDELGIFTFKDLEKGEYSITFEKDGFSTIKKNLIIKAEQTTEIISDMFSEKGSIVGKVVDSSGISTTNLSALLDKTKKITLDKNGKFSIADISAGSHTISILNKNKEIKSVDIEIIAGTELSKEIILDPIKNKIETKKIEEKIKKVEANIPKKETKPVAKKEIKIEPKKKTSKEVKLTKSNLYGKITDVKGSLKGAGITLEGDNITLVVSSDADGNYSLKNIPSGNYKMTISKQDFVSRVFSVKIKEPRKSKYDIKLNLKK
ncbi:MAG: carboxypeptidase regulatory-like domain-containing protein [Cyanobacteriota bacterium]